MTAIVVLEHAKLGDVVRVTPQAAGIGESTVYLRAGEELTFNYGYDLEDYREHPCSCGSLECVGYIVAEEFFDHIRTQASLEANTA